MPHDQLFKSPWLKWGQAIFHTQALEADIEAYSRDSQPYPILSLRADYKPKRHGFAVFVSEVEPVPARWRLRLGDAANNYRAALDHLAWALVSQGRTPPAQLTRSQQKGIYFPINDDRKQFNGELPVKLPGVRRADIAKVRRHQPYHRGVRVRPRHALTLLAKINTGDKHRTIHPVWVQPTSLGIEITHRQDCALTSTDNRLQPQALDIEAEVALIRVRKMGPKPHIEVRPHLTAEPCVDQRVSIQEWCAQCGVLIFGLLREFSEPPAEIRDLGADLVRLSP